MRAGTVAEERAPSTIFSEAGFSLTELLVVMAILSTLTAVALPSLASITSGSTMRNNIFSIAQTVEQARSLAMAHNTHIWIGLANGEEEQRKIVSIGAMASRDGTENLASSNLSPICKIVKLKGMTIETVSGDLPGRETGNGVARVASSDSSVQFQFALPQNETETFTKVIHINPQGEISYPGTKCRTLEIELKPANGQTVLTNNYAAVQLGCLTGSIHILRQ